jgi:prepilin-type N-terminal cleavage/methylation domain-containing protein/prepilin-type processing-associated H-X9-DG protein
MLRRDGIRSSVVRRGNPQGRFRVGFTLIELLVVIAIIAILAAILFPVFSQARAKAYQAACLSNQRQSGLSMLQYLQDYDETFPSAVHQGDCAFWQEFAVNPFVRFSHVTLPYHRNRQFWDCPAAKNRWLIQHIPDSLPCSSPRVFHPAPWPEHFRTGWWHWTPDWDRHFISIAWNMDGLLSSGGFRLAQIAEPAMYVMFADGAHPEANSSLGRIAFADFCAAECARPWDPPPPDFLQNNAWLTQATRHMLGSNITWTDGHSKWMQWSSFVAWWKNSAPKDPTGWPYASRFARTGIWGIEPTFGKLAD